MSDAATHEVCVESRDGFAFAACCAYLRRLDPGVPTALATVLNARDPDARVLLLAQPDPTCPRTVYHDTGDRRLSDDAATKGVPAGHPITYFVDVSAPLAADPRPEAFRRLVMRAPSADAIAHLIRAALDTHRAEVLERRGGGGRAGAVPVHAWDDDAGAWARVGFRPRRPLDTLFLPYGVAEDALDDLRAFFANAEALAAMHVAPIRTYLLHGTPGSGKTSLVHCLAAELGLGVATLSFVPGMTDADVTAAVARVPRGTVLVIEDIDCAFSGRAAQNHGVTFGAVLGALDGHATTADGVAPLAVFATTNHLATLDPALRRRVDYVQEFRAATFDQVRRLFDAFFPAAPVAHFDAVWTTGRGAAMSVFQKYLVKARQVGDAVSRLDVLRALADCAAGTCAASHEAMYS